MTISPVRRADLVRQASARVAARVRAADHRQLAEQRRFELRVNSEVKASIEGIYKERCAEPIQEAVAANKSSVLVDIPTYYGDKEPVHRPYWWKASVRCKAIVEHLSAYLKNEGFVVTEGEQYHTRTFRGSKPGNLGLHAIPLTIRW